MSDRVIGPRATAVPLRICDFTPAWRARFWAKVDRTESCWLWTRATAGNGYGVVCTKALGIGRKMMYAHRLAWAMTFGPIPEGMVVMHQCDTPACCNPGHLELGKQADNVVDMIRKGRGRRKAKLSRQAVAQLRADYAAGGVTFFDLADKYGISFQHAHAIVRGARRAS